MVNVHFVIKTEEGAHKLIHHIYKSWRRSSLSSIDTKVMGESRETANEAIPSTTLGDKHAITSCHS